jgi:hypothetical protein
MIINLSASRFQENYLFLQKFSKFGAKTKLFIKIIETFFRESIGRLFFARKSKTKKLCLKIRP